MSVERASKRVIARPEGPKQSRGLRTEPSGLLRSLRFLAMTALSNACFPLTAYARPSPAHALVGILFPMLGIRRIQAQSIFLLAVFLSAGTTLPSLDGLLFHGAGESGRAQTHIEPAGGCLEHGQHCVLGRTAPGVGALAALGAEVTAAPPAPPASSSPTSSVFNPGIAGAPNSRAPPVSLA